MAAAGTALVTTQAERPALPPVRHRAPVTPEGTLLTPSPGLNIVGTDPTRVFPDLAQILVNNTNAVTGACPENTAVWPTPACRKSSTASPSSSRPPRTSAWRA